MVGQKSTILSYCSFCEQELDLMMVDFKRLRIWQLGLEIAEKCYLFTKDFPRDEQFGLTNQIKRSGVSISSNIAEGSGRGSGKEFCHFLSIAIGSCFELETQILISAKLNVGNPDLITDLLNLISLERRMLIQFRKKVFLNNCGRQSKS